MKGTRADKIVDPPNWTIKLRCFGTRMGNRASVRRPVTPSDPFPYHDTKGYRGIGEISGYRRIGEISILSLFLSILDTFNENNLVDFATSRRNGDVSCCC